MLQLPLLPSVVAVLVAISIIILVGPRMVRLGDRLADVTGLGEAFVGAVLIGITTSLPDLIATVLPAVRGLPELAVGNALGGVLAQTVFLAIADLTYRRANLEHAAASLPNLVQATLLITLLGGVLVLLHTVVPSVLWVHPGSFVLVGIYVYGMRIVREAKHEPMWEAVDTAATEQDVPDEPTSDEAAGPLWVRFGISAAMLATGGLLLAVGGESLVTVSGLEESTVGVFVTGFGSSLAELVVSLAAVRAGALTLAVANVIGGNTFDTLLVVVADAVYVDGPIYADVGTAPTLVATLSLVATAILVLGLLRRERHGVGNIGVESVAVLGIYALAFVLVA